jgi:hypothetical protein
MNQPIADLEIIIATVDLPEQQILRGDIGTIVHVYDNPSLAYEVEFVNPDGSTRALLTMTPNQLRPLTSHGH